MSQWREDRDAEGVRHFLLVLGGVDPRHVRARSYKREVAIGVMIGLVLSGLIWAAALL